jgi:hypothetical protein
VIVFEDLDELAKGLAENDLSRRQAIKWAGYSVLGAALSSNGLCPERPGPYPPWAA